VVKMACPCIRVTREPSLGTRGGDPQRSRTRPRAQRKPNKPHPFLEWLGPPPQRDANENRARWEIVEQLTTPPRPVQGPHIPTPNSSRKQAGTVHLALSERLDDGHKARASVRQLTPAFLSTMRPRNMMLRRLRQGTLARMTVVGTSLTTQVTTTPEKDAHDDERAPR